MAGPIAPIAPISPITPILAIPRVVGGAFQPKNRFHLDDWPEEVRKKFARGPAAWLDALAEAIKLGIKEEKPLADLIFFMHHPKRMKLDEGRLINAGEKEFVQLRAEWSHYRTIVVRRLRPSTIPTVFQKAQSGRKYEDFVAAQTRGAVSLFANGRKGDGKGKFVDAAQGCEEMQKAVEAAGPKDSIFIANWQFIPTAMNLTPAGSGMANWGDLLLSKAKQGVRIRVIISQQPPFSPFQTPMNLIENLVGLLAGPDRPNFKFILSPHSDPMGTHHQKLLIVKGAKSTTAFCGGLDISGSRAPPWSKIFVWHDIQAKFEGLIALDLEREFVGRWNREKAKNLAKEVMGWNGLEELKAGSPQDDDRKKGKDRNLQMLRTVAFGSSGKDIKRDDIWQAYFRLIGRATRFLYLENQYFHEPLLGAAIARQAESQPGLIVMVVVSTGTDDVGPGVSQGQKDWVANGRALRHEFFKQLAAIPKDRLRVYTIFNPDGLLHSKLILADDEVLSIGSANANPRGFFFDSEVNVMVEDPKVVRNFRHQLWAHNLGVTESSVARWREKDFFAMWDMIAEYNLDHEPPPNTPKDELRKMTVKMLGDMVLKFEPLDPNDKRSDSGKKGPITLPFGLSLPSRHVWF